MYIPNLIKNAGIQCINKAIKLELVALDPYLMDLFTHRHWKCLHNLDQNENNKDKP